MSQREIQTSSRPGAEMLAAVRRVAADAARRGDEIDQARCLPQDLYDALLATKFFRGLAPQEYGGLDLPLSVVNEAIVEGSRANGSLGWLMMVGSSQELNAGFQTKAMQDVLLGGERPMRIRGLIAPKGVAVRTEGGYRITGRWPFGSGGPNPDFIGGNCIVFEDGRPRFNAEGAPEMLTAMMSASDVEPIDTWRVLGMRGTDSRDFAVKDLFVPADRCVNIYTAQNSFDTLPSRLPLRVLLSTTHCAVAIGVALGALDDIIELSKTKRHSMDPTSLLADDPVFRHNLGEHTLRLTACEAMLEKVTNGVVQFAADRSPVPPREVLIGRTMSGYITSECAKIVDWAFTAAGSTSVYDSSSLQRRLRDIHVATQHAACHTEPYRLLAATLLGEELSAMQLF